MRGYYMVVSYIYDEPYPPTTLMYEAEDVSPFAVHIQLTKEPEGGDYIIHMNPQKPTHYLLISNDDIVDINIVAKYAHLVFNNRVLFDEAGEWDTAGTVMALVKKHLYRRLCANLEWNPKHRFVVLPVEVSYE
ncbi:MAG: hypothetical protein D6750_03690 [Bacteroidetes bacterium]|nr:MAG: hypothetical protein D6750_03690 [Bacteroidota bacterium]